MSPLMKCADAIEHTADLPEEYARRPLKAALRRGALLKLETRSAEEDNLSAAAIGTM
jgi:hypothetical protein